jgi:sigma-B regulation protein RsbU (phosphoserine phosphatase)
VPIRVLLVEDDPGYARLVAEVLTESGEHHVTTVPTLGDALVRLDAEDVDIVMLDLGLPDADGIEAVVQVRAKTPWLPIVVLSAQGNLDVAVESMRAGAQEYLVKGQAEQHLVHRAIRSAVERKRVQDFEQLLVGVVGHDLRNPLQTIALAAEISLRDPTSSPEQRKRIERIVAATTRANSLVHDLLDLTRVRFLGKALPVTRRETDVTAIVRQAVDDACQASGQSRVVFDGDHAIVASVDPDRFAQIVTNLIGNALQHGDKQTPAVVRIAPTEEGVRLDVHNAGPPIPHEFRHRLFEPLRRASEAERDGNRFGLGLYIVQEIVKAHGGTIDVTSDADEGTTFRVTLPR